MEHIPLLFRSAMYTPCAAVILPDNSPFRMAARHRRGYDPSKKRCLIDLWIPRDLRPSREDPQVAQAILTSIATSIMTVVYCVRDLAIDADPCVNAILAAES